MRSAFTVLDDNLVNLRAQYAQARRFVLCREGVPVAAAVAEAHANHATLEVPILAAAKTQRQKGHGSLLVALLIEVAAQLRTTKWHVPDDVGHQGAGARRDAPDPASRALGGRVGQTRPSSQTLQPPTRSGKTFLAQGSKA